MKTLCASACTVLLAICGAVPAWAGEPPRTAPTTAAPQPAKVAAPVTPALDRQEIRAQLSPRRYTTLAAEIGAKISRIAVQEGGTFRAGQTLVSLDCSTQQAQLERARAALSGAEKTFSANIKLAELNSVGKVELELSEAEVGKAQAEVKMMSVALSKCNIAAPFSGRIAEQKVREQQFVQAGQPMLEIIDDSVLELEFIVPSKWLAWLRAGSSFQVVIDETAKTYPAKVLRIGAKVDPISQSIKLVAAIDGKFPELIAGMSGRINLSPPAGK